MVDAAEGSAVGLVGLSVGAAVVGAGVEAWTVNAGSAARSKMRVSFCVQRLALEMLASSSSRDPTVGPL